MRRSRLLAAAAAFSLCFAAGLAGCGDDSDPTPAGSGGGGGGGGAEQGEGGGGRVGEAGAGGAGGAVSAGGAGGGDQIACNLFDLEGSSESCQSCVSGALFGACQQTSLACIQNDPALLGCSTQAGCISFGQDPPIDLGCLALNCSAELIQLNVCLLGCEAYAACFR